MISSTVCALKEGISVALSLLVWAPIALQVARGMLSLTQLILTYDVGHVLAIVHSFLYRN